MFHSWVINGQFMVIHVKQTIRPIRAICVHLNLSALSALSAFSAGLILIRVPFMVNSWPIHGHLCSLKYFCVFCHFSGTKHQPSSISHHSSSFGLLCGTNKYKQKIHIALRKLFISFCGTQTVRVQFMTNS